MIAIDILKEKGFGVENIHEEYSVNCGAEGEGVTVYLVDIAGIRKDYKVAIECGDAKKKKITDLRKIFDEIIVIDAGKILELYDKIKEKYINETKTLKQELDRAKESRNWIAGDANSKLNELNREIDSLKEENRHLKIKLNRFEKVIAEAWEAYKIQEKS